jgi:3-phosphoshikimate 1-carboxyvinyltransferase
MSRLVVEPGPAVGGGLRVPGDKSISHRALMLGAIAEGTTRATGFLPGEDCLATMAAVRALGIAVRQPDATTIEVDGQGPRGLTAPAAALDMGNSGTAMRLFMGLLAAQPFTSQLVGDASLSRRPMDRVARPLREMGADIDTRDGRPPVVVRGTRSLHGIDYALPVASAQVKSAVLLAGLHATGETTVHEPAPTRDHTERMLAQLGAEVRSGDGTTWVRGGAVLRGRSLAVPGDLSSAAFMLLAGVLAARGELVIDDVGLNPTRTGVLRILELMGARLQVEAGRDDGGEPRGRIIVRPGRLRAIAVPPELVPLAIDEFPMLFVAAALAEGTTVISGAAELRQKESDRIQVMADGLRALGIAVTDTPDGARIEGGRLSGGTVDSHGDHRVAMAFAIGAGRAAGSITILDTANVATSYPGFVAQAASLGLGIRETHD